MKLIRSRRINSLSIDSSIPDKTLQGLTGDVETVMRYLGLNSNGDRNPIETKPIKSYLPSKMTIKPELPLGDRIGYIHVG